MQGDKHLTRGSNFARISLSFVAIAILTLIVGASAVRGQGGSAEKHNPSTAPKKATTSSKTGRTSNVKRPTSTKSSPSSRNNAAVTAGSPSLGETLEWLKNNVSPYYLETHGEASSNGDNREYQLEVRWTPVRFNGCTLVWNEALEDRLGTDPFNEIRTETVQLSDIDPSHIKVFNFKINNINFYGVGLETSNGKQTIKFHREIQEINGDKNRRVEENKVARTGLIFRDEETAQRGSKALENAIKLCGGKSSSF